MNLALQIQWRASPKLDFLPLTTVDYSVNNYFGLDQTVEIMSQLKISLRFYQMKFELIALKL